MCRVETKIVSRLVYTKLKSGDTRKFKVPDSHHGRRIFRAIGIILLFIIGDKSCLAHDAKLIPSEPRWSGASDPHEISYGNWSTAEECLRPCTIDQEPLYCYYQFTLEYYTTMNGACMLCRPKNTNQLSNIGQCECVEADGFERTVLTVNRMIPGPSIQVCQNDMLIIDVENNMDGTSVALHWHGIFQQGYQYYDGVPYLTQCPIHSRNKFRYQFRAKNAGTHFWHSHIAVHKIDGQYGSLIVRQPPSNDPHSGLYDKDLPTHVLVLSDWMHELSMERYPGLLKRLRGQGPVNVLINGKGTWDEERKETSNTSVEILDVEPGVRYRIRMINAFSTVCLAHLNIENHTVRIIAQDGENVEPEDVDSIITGSGERVDFILTANQPANRSYWIRVRAINERRVLSVYQLAVLRYTTSSSSVPPTERPTYWNGLPRGIVYNPLDARCSGERIEKTICVHELKSISSIESKLLAVEADYQFVISFKFYSYKEQLERLYEPGSYRRFLISSDEEPVVSVMNGIVYEEPTEPPIYLPFGNNAKCNASTNNRGGTSDEPRACSHTLDIKKGSVVEIVLVDTNEKPLLTHPFHLHGHNFRIFDIGRFPGKGNVTRDQIETILRQHKKRLAEGFYSKVLPAKDTVVVPVAGWAILRFNANNPGWWFFHCHFLWHTVNGMNLVIHVGEQSDLPPVPPGFPRCGNFVPPIRPYE